MAVLAAVLVDLMVAGMLIRSSVFDTAADDLDPTLVAVCRLSKLAPARQPGEARRALTSDVHGPLHPLAHEAADNGDRVAAARPLEVKERTESSPDGPVAAQANALEAAAAEAAGRPAGGCT